MKSLRQWLILLRDNDAAELFDRARRVLRLPGRSPKAFVRPAGNSAAAPLTGRPRVVAVTHTLELQGASISLVEILIGLTKSFDIHLVSPRAGPLGQRVADAGIPIHLTPVPQESAASSRGYEASLKAFAHVVADLRPNLIVANSMATFHAIDAARILGVPSVWAIREGGSPELFFAPFPRSVQARALGCLDYPAHFVFVSEHTMSRWPSSSVPRRAIHTSLEPERTAMMTRRWSRDLARASLRCTAEDHVVLTVGTLCKDKGQLDTLRALPLALKRAPSFRFVWVGDWAEPGGKRIDQELRTLPQRLRERLMIHPSTADVAKFYAAADTYLCSSRHESYPRSVLEAMAFGLPIVAAPIDGIPEMVVRYGFSPFQPSDPADLAHVLLDIEGRRVAHTPERIDRQVLEENYRAMVAEHARVFDSVLRARGEVTVSS